MIGCILVTYFAAAVERRDDPSLAMAPLVIYELSEDSVPTRGPPFPQKDTRVRGGKVFGFSDEMAEMGIEPGMSLRQVRALCPQARFIPADQVRYQHALDSLTKVLSSFTPHVESGGFQPASVSYLELTTSSGRHLERSEAIEMARRIGQAVREKVGLAPAIGLAAGKFPAYVAAASVEPNKALLVPPGHEAVFLAPFPVDLLPLDEKMTHQLQLLGIRTLGQLATLPVGAVLTQFGMQGQWLHQLARGYDNRPVLPYRHEVKESMSRQLDGPIANRIALEAVAQAMILELSIRLQAKGLAVRELRLLLHMENGATHKEQITIRQPNGDPKRLAYIIGQLLTRAEIQQGVTELEVILTDLIPSAGQQLDLFVHQTGQESRLHEVLKDLVARYDANCFYHVSLLNRGAHLPERRFRLKRVDAS
jgi:DNA polymerase-4